LAADRLTVLLRALACVLARERLGVATFEPDASRDAVAVAVGERAIVAGAPASLLPGRRDRKTVGVELVRRRGGGVGRVELHRRIGARIASGGARAACGKERESERQVLHGAFSTRRTVPCGSVK